MTADLKKSLKNFNSGCANQNLNLPHGKQYNCIHVKAIHIENSFLDRLTGSKDFSSILTFLDTLKESIYAE